MKQIEQFWFTKKGLQIYSQKWEPENSAIKAVVCLVHGLGEHSGRYEHVAKHLTEDGFSLLGFDLRGHGKSEGIRGHVDSAEDFLEDIDSMLNEARNSYPETPLFLYGHSLGGLLVLFYTLKRQPDLAGVVATSPGLRTSLESQKLKLGFAKALALIFPRLSIKSGLVIEDISSDPDILRLYLDDPLVHDQGTLMMARTCLEIIQWTFDNASEFNLPLLMMHGTADKVAFSSGSEDFAQAVGCDCTVKLWEGFYHETHNEPGKVDVMDAMVEWLESKL